MEGIDGSMSRDLMTERQHPLSVPRRQTDVRESVMYSDASEEGKLKENIVTLSARSRGERDRRVSVREICYRKGTSAHQNTVTLANLSVMSPVAKGEN